MKRSVLVQRLKAPIDGLDVFGDDPFINAGGVRNWGLSERAMDLLKGILKFDYMGAAGFEWGAVPKGLQKIANHAQEGELIGYVMFIPLREVEHTVFDENNEPPEGTGTIWIICRKEDVNEVSRRIRAWAAHDSDSYGKQNDDSQWWLCEPTKLNAALRPNPPWPSDICGWVELDNGFFFFTNEEMYNKVRQLFMGEEKQ